MIEQKILSHLMSRVEERMKQLSESLIEGTVKDFAEYQYLRGTIRGLGFAQSEITDLVRRMREIEDE